MAKNNVQWRKKRMSLPSTLLSWNSLVWVRTDGKSFHVAVERTVSKPCYDGAEEYIRELQEACKGVIEARLDFQEGDEDSSSEMILTGWREPTEVEMNIIKEHTF